MRTVAAGDSHDRRASAPARPPIRSRATERASAPAAAAGSRGGRPSMARRGGLEGRHRREGRRRHDLGSQGHLARAAVCRDPRCRPRIGRSGCPGIGRSGGAGRSLRVARRSTTSPGQESQERDPVRIELLLLAGDGVGIDRAGDFLLDDHGKENRLHRVGRFEAAGDVVAASRAAAGAPSRTSRERAGIGES